MPTKPMLKSVIKLRDRRGVVLHTLQQKHAVAGGRHGTRGVQPRRRQLLELCHRRQLPVRTDGGRRAEQLLPVRRHLQLQLDGSRGGFLHSGEVEGEGGRESERERVRGGTESEGKRDRGADGQRERERDTRERDREG